MKDSSGNELAVGDTIHIRCGLEWLDGVIVNIQEGGISLAAQGGQNVQTSPGVVIQCSIPTPSQAGMPNPYIRKIAVKNALESSIKM